MPRRQRCAAPSLVTSTLGSLGTLVLAGLAAMTFSFLEFRAKAVLFLLILLPRMFPPVTTVIPIQLMLKSMGLIDTKTALIILFIGFQIPLALWVLHTFLADVPRELAESAAIDGASLPAIVMRILLPLAGPGLLAAFIFACRLLMPWIPATLLLSLALVPAAQRHLQLEAPPGRAVHGEPRAPLALLQRGHVGHVARHEQWRPDLGGAARDHRRRRVVVHAGDRGHAGLQDPGLLAGDRGVGVPQHLRVVQADRRDRAHRGREHVRGVQPPAEPDLDHGPAHRVPREDIERERSGDLEERARTGARQRFDRVQAFVQLGLGEPAAVHADALAEVDQVRRRVEPGALPGGAQHALDQGAHTALAVRARHVHRVEAPLRVPEPGQQLARALESQLQVPAFEPPQGLEPALHYRALAGSGLALEDQQKWAQAARYYDEVAAKSPDKTLRAWAKERRAAISAKLNPAEPKPKPSGEGKTPPKSSSVSKNQPSARVSER